MGIGGSDIFSATYRLVDADLGSIISVEVQAFNEGGYQMSPLSSGVGPIMPDPLAQPPVNRIPPMLYPADAPGVVGTYIQTTNGGWDTSNPPVVLEWLRDGSPIIGETEYFYLLAMADVGAMISSAATASNATGSTRAPSSNSIGPITGPLQEEGEEEDMNLIINGNFAINQRGYAQTGLPPIGPDGYGHDRWKAGPSGFCTYQFTQALPDTAIRIITGTLVQVVEGGVIADGPHTLSWDGTAQARVYQGAPTGAYAPSPITTPPLNAGANTTVEFSGDAGTLTKVKFEAGEVATPFNRETLAKSMADCQRYYQVGQLIQGGSVASVGVVIYHSSMLPVVMRAVPTVTGTPVTESNVTYSTAGSYGSSSIYIGWTSGALGAYVGVASFTASAEL
jgi:hypothetical protein